MALPAYQAVLLQAKAYRILRTDVTSLLKPFEISLPEWCTINLISQNPTIRSTEIAHELGVEIPMVTTLLHQLEQKCILNRTYNLADKRCRIIKLTDLGKETISLIADKFQSASPTCFDGTSAEDMQAYVRVLQTVIAKR